VEAVIKFQGGPLDGEVLAADQIPAFDQIKAVSNFDLTAARQDGVIQQAENGGAGLVLWFPHLQTFRQADAQQWTMEKIDTSMRYHEYRLANVEEADGRLTFEARYSGVT
jgi:hypothetical protein